MRKSPVTSTSLAPQALHPLLAEALRKKGYDTLTPVQGAVADPALAGRDMLVSSRTGSGKTVAYGLGMAGSLLGAGGLPPAGKPLALVIAPTRELALQVQRELRWLYEETGAIITTCVGGMDQRAERRHLERGVHIVVGTPGRLVDHLTRRALALDALKVAVLDEADEMLDLGFREDLETLLAATPEGRRTLLFSATLPKGIATLAQKFQRNAARIEVAGDVAGHADIEHRAAFVKPHAIEHGVVNLLRESESPAALVFLNTRDGVRHLHATLIERGFSAVILSGELGQHDRNQALQALRDGRAKVCIATDVAARGIDLPHLGLVIHADLPHDSEVLQHRSGRTGRAGRKGVSVMLVPPGRRAKAMRLFAEGGISPQWIDLPSAETIRALDRTRLLADETPFTEFSEPEREMAAAFLAARPAEEIAAALARIFLARLPEPEEVESFAPGELRPVKPGKPPFPVHAPQEYRWFELNVGRQDKAEPKGILRMLTRAGGVERRFVGNIRIHDGTTHVQIATEVAERFERKHANAGADEIRVRAIEEAAPKPRREFAKKPKREGWAPAFEADEFRDDKSQGDARRPGKRVRDERETGKPFARKDAAPKDFARPGKGERGADKAGKGGFAKPGADKPKRPKPPRG